MYYWTTNRYFKVETALLQFLSNLDYKNSFVYWTIEGYAKQTICVHKIQGPYEPSSERSIRVNGSLPKNIP